MAVSGRKDDNVIKILLFAAGLAMGAAASAPVIEASDGAYTDKVLVTGDTTPPSGYEAEIYRAESAGGTQTLLGTTPTDYFEDTEAYPGKLYYYSARICDMNKNCTAMSESDSGFRKLSPPTHISATDNTYTDRIEVADFTGVEGATSYKIYRAETETGEKTYIGTSYHETFDDTQSHPCIEYWYFAKACAATGCSAYSSYTDTGTKKLEEPDCLASKGAFTDRIVIESESISYAARYRFYRAENYLGARTEIGTVAVPRFEDDDPAVIPGKEYVYFTQACCSNAWCSDYVYGNGHVPDGNKGYRALRAPAGITASDGRYRDSVVVSRYSGIEGATSYKIFRSDEAAGTKTLLEETADENITDRNVLPEKRYWYFVQACRGDICSDFSEADTGFASKLQGLPAVIFYLLR